MLRAGGVVGGGVHLEKLGGGVPTKLHKTLPYCG